MSFNKRFKNFKNNVITFGDKELGAHVDYHYPLCIDFSILNFTVKISPSKCP